MYATQTRSSGTTPYSAAAERGAQDRPGAHAPQAQAWEVPHGRDAEQSVGYELFRRAILLHDQEAWTEISARYRPMLIGWALQCSAMGSTDEQCDDIADRALARAWVALSPERFAQFPNLASLLAYLRTCVTATAIDAARAQTVRERAYSKLDLAPTATPEQVVLDELERDELWQVVLATAACEQERVVLVESFQLDLPPRTILARHPDLFDTIGAVYLAKRHLLGRLQRSPEVQRFIH